MAEKIKIAALALANAEARTVSLDEFNRLDIPVYHPDRIDLIVAAVPALLRLARAAKSVTDNLEPHSPMFANHDCAVCDLRAALDAFDFS